VDNALCEGIDSASLPAAPPQFLAFPKGRRVINDKARLLKPRMKKAFVFLCFLAFLAADVDTLAAQPLHDAVPHPGKKLIVGVVQDPPYIIKERDGQWSGLNVEIWKSIVRDLRIDYEFREMTFKELLVSKEKVLDVLSLQP
jgi:hypothetical protein